MDTERSTDELLFQRDVPVEHDGDRRRGCPSTATFIRKRPSRATAYCGFELRPRQKFLNRREPRREERHRRARLQRLPSAPTAIGTAIRRRRAPRKTAPSRRAATAVGSRPPLTPATCRRVPETAGRTPPCPDSFDSYATHRPSGENCPAASSKGVCTTGNGLRLGRLSRGDWQRPEVRPGLWILRGVEQEAPSGDQATGAFGSAVTNRGCSPVAPLASFSNRSMRHCDWTNTTRRPSGDHKGSPSALASNVNRLGRPRSDVDHHRSTFPCTAR